MSLSESEGAYGLEIADETIGWIYKLRKDDLQQELLKHGAKTTGTVEELRSRLKNIIRENRPPASPNFVNQNQPQPATPIVPNMIPVTVVLDQVRKWNVHFDGKKMLFLF